MGNRAVHQPLRKCGPAIANWRVPQGWVRSGSSADSVGGCSASRKCLLQSVETLRNWCAQVSLIFDRDTLADIKPPFKDDTDIVSPSPHEPTFCNCKKAVEGDVEVYRKETEPIRMDLMCVD